MASIEQKNLSSDRIRGPPSANVDLLECPICQDILWKSVACQSCETSFCSSCINRWLTNNPNKCPNRCASYTERRCPPLILKLLAQLQLTCSYQEQGCEEIIPYEALEKHEQECGYQPQQCPGCRLEILKRDFGNHTKNCAAIELTCEDCKLVYKRGEAATRHTENICLKEQLRRVCNESRENKLLVEKLTQQLNEVLIWKTRMNEEVTIKFDDLPNAEEGTRKITKIYRHLKWTEISYGHEVYWKKQFPKSGYVTSFISGGSSHIAYIIKEASISVEQSGETFTLISLSACAAWNDNLQLTITAHSNSRETNTHTTTLLFGKPQLILLQWKDIDKVIFKPFGGILHPGSGQSAGLHVIITQLIIGPHDLKPKLPLF